MSLDPQNPAFRSIDKLILLLALVVAALAVYNTFQKQSLVKQTVATMGRELKTTEDYVSLLVPPKEEGMQLTAYNDLQGRFERLDVPPHRFRDFVFYTPGERVLPKLSVQLVAGKTTQPVTEFDPITPAKLPAGVTLEMMSLTVSDKAVAEVKADNEKGVLLITPKSLGICVVRLVGVEGSRIELSLEITPIEIMVPNNPELPENFAAVPNRGYNTISWKTNPKSIPAETYTICRSTVKGEDPEVLTEIKVEDRELPSKAAIDAIMAKAAAQGLDPERLCTPTIIEYSWDDLDVKPGVEYFYYIKTACVIRDKDRKESLEETRLSAPVSAKASSPFVVSLAGGFGDTARIEVERWFGYVPRYKTFMVHCGELIGDKEYATGLMLVAFDEVASDPIRSVPFKDKDGRVVIDNVPVLAMLQRAVVVDEKSNAQELLQDRGNKMAYDRNVSLFFKTCEKDPAPLQSPRFLPVKDGGAPIKGSSVVTVVNESSNRLTVGMRAAREKLLLDVPAFSRRKISVDPGQYELGAMYAPDNPDDSPIVVYEPAKHDLKDNQVYQITFELKKAAGAAAAAIR